MLNKEEWFELHIEYKKYKNESWTKIHNYEEELFSIFEKTLREIIKLSKTLKLKAEFNSEYIAYNEWSDLQNKFTSENCEIDIDFYEETIHASLKEEDRYDWRDVWTLDLYFPINFFFNNEIEQLILEIEKHNSNINELLKIKEEKEKALKEKEDYEKYLKMKEKFEPLRHKFEST